MSPGSIRGRDARGRELMILLISQGQVEIKPIMKSSTISANRRAKNMVGVARVLGMFLILEDSRTKMKKRG